MKAINDFASRKEYKEYLIAYYSGLIAQGQSTKEHWINVDNVLESAKNLASSVVYSLYPYREELPITNLMDNELPVQ